MRLVGRNIIVPPLTRQFEKAHESPNRKVGVLSLRPTGNGAAAPRNPPTGRLGIFQVPAFLDV